MGRTAWALAAVALTGVALLATAIGLGSGIPDALGLFGSGLIAWTVIVEIFHVEL